MTRASSPSQVLSQTTALTCDLRGSDMRTSLEVAKLTKARRAARAVRVEDRLDALLAVRDALAGEIDAFGRHVGEFEIGDGSDRNALGDEIALVDPAADNALRIAKETDGQVLARVAEARLDETLGDVVGDRARPYFLQDPRRDLDALADDALQ